MSFSQRSLMFVALVAALLGHANAQELPVIDQEEIDAAVREISPEVASFAAEVAKRAEAYSEEATSLSANALDRMKDVRSNGESEIDHILSLAPQIAEAREMANKQAVGVMVFASFSMDETALRTLIVDAHAAGVPVVLRGFIDGSLSATAQRMRSLLGRAETADGAESEFLGGVIIDPRAYRVFDVREVPAFIALDGPLPDCDGLDCSAPAPAHDRIAGNISLSAALSALASEGDHAVRHAQIALSALERGS